MENSERMLSILLSHIPGAVYRCKNDPDWTMEYLSDGIRDITGYAAEEFLHNRIRSFSSIIVPEDRATVAAKIQKALDTQQSYSIEYRIITTSGIQKWISESGSVAFSSDNQIITREGFLTDITERKKAEEVLRESENKFRDLAEKSNVGVYLAEKGIFRYVNSQFAEMHGYTPEEIINKKRIKDVIPPDFLPVFQDAVNKWYLTEDKVDSLHTEIEILQRDGATRPCEIHIARTTYQGKPAVTGTLLDITERKTSRNGAQRKRGTIPINFSKQC